jgi:hypothetical protein
MDKKCGGSVFMEKTVKFTHFEPFMRHKINLKIDNIIRLIHIYIYFVVSKLYIPQSVLYRIKYGIEEKLWF